MSFLLLQQQLVHYQSFKSHLQQIKIFQFFTLALQQCEDLNQLKFSCSLEFTSFSSSSLLLLLSSGKSIDFKLSSLYSGSSAWPNKKSSLLILEPPLSKLPSGLIQRKGFHVHQAFSLNSLSSQYVLSVSYLQE